MAVLGIGISHKTAPLDVRERLAFAADELPGALAELRERFGGGVVLSTCNRTEVYISSHAAMDDTVLELERLVLGLKRYPEDVAPPHFNQLLGMHAVRHLYRVACGIDSLVVGEAQILGQVRSAMVSAEEAGALNPVLSRLLHSAVNVGRRARSQTAIGSHAVSISSAAVGLARSVLGDLSQRTVLVVSAGEAGKLAARHAREYGAQRLIVTNRSAQRALELAERLGATAVPFERLAESLAQADVVLSSTGASSYLIDRPMVEQALIQRPERPLLFIDLAVPRDIDPAAGDVPGVYLYDIDDLQAGNDEHLKERTAEIDKVERIVDEETQRFAAWWRAREAAPTIAALRGRAESIREAELSRTLARLPNLTPDERRRIEAMSAAIVKRMLHEPIAKLRSGGRGARYVEALQELFDLPPPDDAASA